MTSANPSKDEPTSMKRKLSPVEDDKPAKKPTLLETWVKHCKISNVAYPPALLEAWVEHCKILDIPHPPDLVDALEEVEDRLDAQKYGGRCAVYRFPEGPAREAYIADFQRGRARRLEVQKEKEKKRMAKLAKIKQNTEIKAGVEANEQAAPEDRAPGSEHDAEISKTQEDLVDGTRAENINKEVDHASAPEAQSDSHEDKVKQEAGESSETRA
ncbi:hypothetical protein VTO58DRAFT_103372 [Aureobasidium pullulans]